MKHRLKKALINTREKFLSNISEKIDQIEQNQEQLVAKVDELTVELYSKRTSIIPISEKLIITKIYNDIKICLDPRDLSVVPHLVFDGVWEEETTKAWLSLVRQDQTIFDVGANFGYYGLLAAQRPFVKEQKVIYFEANPELIPYINKSLSLNGLHKICKVENLGIDKSDGTAELSILEDFIGCSSLHSAKHLDSYLHGKMPVEVEKKVKIKTTSVDSYCSHNSIKKIDLMKLDIEGFEERAYEGMKCTVKNSPELIIFIEFTKQSYSDPKGFFNQLVNDFKYLYLIDDSGGLYEPDNKNYENMIGSIDSFLVLVLSKKNLKDSS